MSNMDRITIRLRAGQMQTLNELKDALGCSIAIMVRAIISDWLTKNDETLERIITHYKETGEALMNNEILNEKEYDDN